ncbi:MAG TPA: hypothetical protein VFV58_27670 [Blastocatellia bacterium]|nr:hypothetical protein [Blastocatellia bacterium]
MTPGQLSPHIARSTPSGGSSPLKLGRHDEACSEFELAASLTGNARERELPLKRATAYVSNNNRQG